MLVYFTIEWSKAYIFFRRREDNDNVEDMVGSIEERQSTKESCEKEAEVVDWDDYLDEVD